ncbi:hypothetical protein D9756_003436 [Leucocoprinus leucothites]|uniref:Rho1 guanine nucleotide exchange factor 1 n=1 Tax=Leucocoprinus leucothites TaxID=201217 RepID=A0A8H5LJB9_9AGAR|nr:hypothetical protein D9756_003436 [Leucoagaricus leucothites]
MPNNRNLRADPPIPRSSNSVVHHNNPSQIFPGAGLDFASREGSQSFLPNPWNDSQDRTRSRVRSMNERQHPHSETSNRFMNHDPNPSLSFPEPLLSPPSLVNPSLSIPSRSLQHRYSTGDLRSQSQVPIPLHEYSDEFSHQGTKEFEHNPEFRDEDRKEISGSSSDLDAMLSRFQDGQLDDQDQEWHRLVSKEAQEALGKHEVRRQSIIFEIIKGERDYVADLELVQLLFIDGLSTARPQILPRESLSAFVGNVFGNFHEILTLHRQLLYTLFERQREQHPVLQTVADIILDRAVRTEFRSAYEIYIKHYPLAESYHRKELKRNSAYEQFIQSISDNPRVRKRDLITFLSRPVTRLPRLTLLLEETLKTTEKDYEHPDLETLPLLLGILRDCIKSTQPGIEAAESKVKFWTLCESLVYQKGEIIDMDLYDQSRTLVHSSPVTRRVRSESGFHEEWDDLVASLLDNYWKRSSGIPRQLNDISYHGFEDTPDMRKEKIEGGLLDSLRSHLVPIYPFTVFHSSSRSTRRYTLYVASEAQRLKWKNVLSEAIALHQLREDSTKWFDPQNITSSYFRVPAQLATPSRGQGVTGRISSAVPFTFAGRKFLAVGCPAGIFVSVAGREAALQATARGVFNRFIVYSESTVVSYSLELLTRLALGQTTPEMLDASMENLGSSESNIILCKCMQMDGKALVIYASKRRLSSSLNVQIMEAVDQAEMESMARTRKNTRVLSFRSFGEPGFVPRDAFDVIALTKNIAICTQDGIVIADPTNLAQSAATLVPNFQDAGSSPSLSMLKDRLKDARPLGLARIDANELLLIYDSVGCYITKRGIPSRSNGYIRWETQASGFAHRGNHILLISSQFIEIRNINTGRIAQVIEDVDMRLMHSGYATTDRNDRVLVAMRGNPKEDSTADRIVELVETVEYVPQSAVSVAPDIWDEWDM